MMTDKFKWKYALLMFIVGYITCTIYLRSDRLLSNYTRSLTVTNDYDGEKLSNRESGNKKLSSRQFSDYPFEIENDYSIAVDEEFDVTLVTYFSVQEMNYFRPYTARWKGPIVIVVYYRESEKELYSQFNDLCKNRARTQCIPYILKQDTVPINKLKNMGIEKVVTTHFIFAENNLSPTTNLYGDLLSTPGYLWRDPFFVGIVPVFEWSSDSYEEAKMGYQYESKFHSSTRKYDSIPNGPTKVAECLKSYHCRPLSTTTIPMQFVWFSFINYRAMNCIDNNTDVYMVLKKTASLPMYDESVTERGYDNTEFVEKIRYSNMKMGILCSNFFFRVNGIGYDSNTVLEHRKDSRLFSQYDQIRNRYIESLSNRHPIVNCHHIEPIMSGWVSFKPYTWMKEEERDNIQYPRIAVKTGKRVVLDVSFVCYPKELLLQPFSPSSPMNSTESETPKEKREGGVDGSSTPLDQVHVSRRPDANSKRVFISIPPSDNSGDVHRQHIAYRSHGSREDSLQGGRTDSSTNVQQGQLSISMVVPSSLSDSFKAKPPGSPRREVCNQEQYRDSNPSTKEASNLIRDERNTFRNCAFELLDIIEINQNPARFEHGAEILKCGILRKKATHAFVSTWNLKYVIVTIGKLIWYPLPPSMLYTGTIAITDKMRKKQHEMILDENTEPRRSLNRKKNVNHVFDVINKVTEIKTNLNIDSIEELESYIQRSCGSAEKPCVFFTESTESSRPIVREKEMTVEKHFMCESDEERDSWLRAIRNARKGRNSDPTVWFSQRVFMAVRTILTQVHSVEELTRVLNAVVGIPLRVPVYFIQSLTSGARGPAHDSQLNQVMRDLERETVILGERTFQAVLGESDTNGFASKIVFLLMESIRRKDAKLKSWELLRFARNVLLHTYRSQTGGDCYDALETLIPSASLVHIIPKQINASKNPIRISVTDTVPTVNDNMNKEGPYVTSSIDSFFEIVESKHNRVLFCVKATVTSVISKDNFGNPWTLELAINSC